MTRFVSSTNQTAADQPTIRMFVAVDLAFTPTPVRAHDGVGTIQIGGNDYLGVGTMGQVEAITEDVDAIAHPLVLTLSAESSLIQLALDDANGYQNRAATLYLGFQDMATGALMATPETVGVWRMDQMSISLGEKTGTVRLQCEPRLRKEPRIARYTDQDQQMAYSGDRFFDLVPKIAGFQGTWGAKGVANDGGNLVVPGDAHPYWNPSWRTPYRP